MERMRFRESCPSLADRSPAFHPFIPPRIRLASLIPPGRPTVVCLSDRGDLHLLLGQDPVPVFGLQKSFHPLLGGDESAHLPRPLDEHLFQRPAVGVGHERQDIVDGAALKYTIGERGLRDNQDILPPAQLQQLLVAGVMGPARFGCRRVWPRPRDDDSGSRQRVAVKSANADTRTRGSPPDLAPNLRHGPPHSPHPSA